MLQLHQHQQRSAAGQHQHQHQDSQQRFATSRQQQQQPPTQQLGAPEGHVPAGLAVVQCSHHSAQQRRVAQQTWQAGGLGLAAGCQRRPPARRLRPALLLRPRCAALPPQRLHCVAQAARRHDPHVLRSATAGQHLGQCLQQLQRHGGQQRGQVALVKGLRCLLHMLR